MFLTLILFSIKTPSASPTERICREQNFEIEKKDEILFG